MFLRVVLSLVGMVLLVQAKHDHDHHHDHDQHHDSIPRYVVEDGKSNICIIMEARVTFHYMDGNTSQIIDFENSTVQGSCNDSVGGQAMELTLGNMMVGLQFEMTADKTMWHLTDIAVATMNDSNVETLGSANITTVAAHQNESYKCRSMVFEFMDGKQPASIVLEDLHIQAEVTDNELSSAVQSCHHTKPSTNNTVPIAVGAALAGLVLCVIVAYIIGRSRSSRRGYQAV